MTDNSKSKTPTPMVQVEAASPLDSAPYLITVERLGRVVYRLSATQHPIVTANEGFVRGTSIATVKAGRVTFRAECKSHFFYDAEADEQRPITQQEDRP